MIINYLYMCLFVILIMFLVYLNRKEKLEEKKQDAQTDYSKIYLQEYSLRMDNGETWLFFEYKLTQLNKRDYILSHYRQGDIWTNEHGYSYMISELLDREYYEIKYDSSGRVSEKEGPYIIYKLTSIIDMSHRDINYGPVQNNYAGNNYQDNRYSVYYNEIVSVLNAYKTELIQHGIKDSEINSIITSPQDKQKLEYFVEKYEPILRSIEVASAAATLFDILLKLL
ncbi:hypothetical protein D8887_01445 [Streptococcus sanguinis]|uniref:Uncharacterized protein n=2 Tax=Streptococcus sanguinis TaxID=1305 RepID=A0A3R9HU83_STRSA|nr:hypothetical protein [Streptococcus sanguinis]RSI12325.1 hypothetical protein D8887_01445 [Streptococcus sanguinis]RSI31707.1 hypothetical protein D8877_03920 [Streptococcus sanguinis]